MESKNALAELAEEMKEGLDCLVCVPHLVKVYGKAQRIVAELANIEVYHNPYTGDDHWPTKDAAYKAVVACKKIAVGG